MSFEPETNDIVIRQLQEEIAKIREEQFAIALPTNEIGSSSAFGGSSGTALPNIGTSASPPQRINATIDTGVIDKLDYKALFTNKDFAIGEIITGATSGATAEIGDIDIVVAGSTGTLILVPSSITGVFTDNEIIDGDINGRARVDGILFTQIGRGHLNARATTIIAQGLTSTFELHFLDGSIANGQQVWLRPANGQTMIIRRPVTSDGNTGNFDFNETVSVGENQLLILQFHAESNVTPDGGWIPASNVSGGVASGSFGLPIIYDVDDKGDLDGTTSVAIDLSATTAHVTEVRLVEDPLFPGVPISQTIGISGAPPDNKAIPFYLRIEQDSLGGHTIVLPATVFPVPTINTAPDSISTIMLFTSDNGVTFQSMRIIEQAGAGIDTPWTVDHDANSFDLFNIDKLRFFGAGGFSFPVDNNIQGISTAGAGLQFNVALSQSFRFFVGGDDISAGEMLRISQFGFDFFDNKLDRVGSIFFTDSGSFNAQIFPLSGFAELVYNVQGVGSHHSFFAEDALNAVFEMRKDINKSNRDLDLVTNNIVNVDQVQFTNIQGFFPSIDHGVRTITGGAQGIEMNIPRDPLFPDAFQIWFENTAETDSDLEYRFDKTQFSMFQKPIVDTLGLLFTNGGSLVDVLTHIELVASNGPVQTLLFKAGDGATIFDLMEITGTEHNVTNLGGVKFFTDINLQTQNIHNVDLINFVSNNGIVGGNQFAIAGDTSANRLDLNVPLTKRFSFRENDVEFMSLEADLLKMVAIGADPRIQASQFELLTHTLGSVGMIDGMIRLVNNAGSQDVTIGTGLGIVNLTTLASGAGGQTPWLSDIDANTFNLFNLDVLRYAVDGGVIGFGEYGSAVEAGGSKLKWSVPSGKIYEWQINLDRVADMNTASFHMRSNVQTTNPSIITDGAFILALTHTSGTVGMFDGESRLVNNAGSIDVIFRTGGANVNLSTLGAGGGDNLGNHIATQPLDMGTPSNTIINFSSWSSSFGHSFILNPTFATWNLNSPTHFFRWTLGGVQEMELAQTDLNVFNKQITNVVDPLNPQDSATKNYVDTQIATVDVSQWSTFPAIAPVNLATNVLQNFTGWTNAFSQSWIANAVGLNWFLPSGDVYLYNIAGVPKFQISSTSSDFFTVLDMNNNKIINGLDPTSPQDFATKNYVDTQGAGVSPGDNVTWTGIHSFNGSSVSINSPTILLGDSASDNIFILGRVDSNIIPDNNLTYTLGQSGLAWNQLYVDDIISSGTGNWDLNGANIFDVGDIEIDGDLNHDGSRIGFFGTAPQLKGTVDLQGVALFQVVATLSDLLGQLRDYGMINTNV